MLRLLQKILCLLFLAVGLQHARGFTLLGEFDDWQVESVGFGFGEIGGSKSLGEEFRLNTPVLTYAYDSTFLDFFGSDGVKAIDQAFAIMNKLPAVSRMSTNLSEFLTDDAQRTIPSAETLLLRDLKSYTLGLILEHMGLAGESHVFDLRQRISLPNSCQFSYDVRNRNFDPVANVLIPMPTRYVNGTFYGYEIVDFCPNPNFAFAVERVRDPTDIPYNAVASWKGGPLSGLGLRFGSFYINITRDDAGGLRYMYRRNNLNNEVLPTNAVPTAVFGPWQPIDFFGTNNAVTNTLAVRGGIEKVSYRKVRYESTFGTFFKPIVQNYKLPVRVGDKLLGQAVRRVLVQPDIIIAAADLSPPANGPLLGPAFATRTSSPRYLTNGVTGTPSSVGPGTVIPQTRFTFHKALPGGFNFTDFFLDEITVDPDFLWASFDGTTNDPVVYPQGTSLREIERQVLTRNTTPNP